MYRYIVNRVLLVIPTLIGAAALVFVLMRLIPGDICVVRLSSGGGSVDPRAVAVCHAELGLDRPLILQFLDFVWGFLRLDFGISMWSGKPVAEEIAARLPISLEIALMATVVAILIAIPLGTVSALKQNSWIDHVVRTVAIAGIATPSFWLGIVSILIVLDISHAAFGAPWMPSIDYVPFWQDRKTSHVLRILTSNRMTSLAGQTGQIVGRNWDTCGTVRDVSSGKRSEPFFRKDHLACSRAARPRDRPRSPPGGMGGARAIGRRCNPALAPMLFPGAVNNHGTKPGVLCACSAPLFGTIAGNIMSLRATPSSTGLKTGCLLLLAIVMAGGVGAQPANYPNKPVRIISDGAPGGAIDTNLRIIAERLSKKWAQQLVIENRPGAGGAISATAAAEAP